jgi:hypothetical protein
MRKDLLPKHLQNLIIRGAQDDDGDESEEDSDDEKSGDEGEEEEQEKDDKAEDTTALKSALQKERRARKNNERELKKLQKLVAEQGDKEKSESDKAKEQASTAESKAQKLAVKLRDSAIDNAIIKVSGKLKFRDVDDALLMVDRDAIEVDQDEDDPTQIELDEGSVETALQALAKKKPHLILADGQGEPSGGKFGGSRKSPEKLQDAEMMERYDAFKNLRPAPASSK